MNVMLESGVAASNIGTLLIPKNSVGKLIVTTGTPELEPFVLMEDIAATLTADGLYHVMATGY